ncbi:MAG TPA: hypothetical protein VFJ64_04880 [Solirubrobacterales bacterium]|nr:hypothetical protein [Solirubrobacterales bacterium]
MSRADKIVAQRERDAIDAQKAANEAARDAMRHEREDAWQRVLAELGPATESLESRDWPGARTLTLERRTFFGYKKYTRAGREVLNYEQPWKDGALTVRVYLLSDGRLAMTSLTSTMAINKGALEHVLNGDAFWGSLPIEAVSEGLRSIAAEGQPA